jgi:ribose-phosphate pyrophosphokinase
VDTLLENGARPHIYVACTHPILVGPAIERLSRPEIAELIVTDTIPLSAQQQSGPRTTILSVAPLFAEAIQRIWSDESVSSLFND